MEPTSETSATTTLPEGQNVAPVPPISTTKRSNLPWVFGTIAIVVLLGLIAFGALPRIFQQQALIQDTKKQNSESPSVSVTVAQPGASIEEFVLPGSTQAIQVASIYARVNGYLDQRFANIGDHVSAGQVLATIDTPEIDQQVQAADSAVQQASAQVENARETQLKAQADMRTVAANVRKGQTDLQFYTAEVKRYTGLAKQGAVSLEDRDSHIQQYNGAVATLESLNEAERSAKATYNSAAAAVKAAQSALDTSKAQLKQVTATRSFKKVTAPFSGIVTKRNVDAGALITSGSNNSNAILFEVAKTDVLRVFVYVPEQYVPYVHSGEKAFLNFPEYPRQDFVGTVTNVSGGLDETSKTLQVEIHVPNQDHVLMPGMYAKVRFQAPSTLRLPVVPASTLQTRADGSFVYVVDANNVVHMHKLEVGRDLGGQFEVSKGVNTGDKVIISPQDTISDGMKVEPVLAPVPKLEGK
ncbi:MAG: efflux RND transporter periplasmic adaptor subunit [Candidatus Melainabacteria bacterium]|nr:efflux RND transporter periplasmic adaptor subunit [Candidatus Melainabacteria bacterium]